MSWSSSPPNLQQARTLHVASLDSNQNIVVAGGAVNLQTGDAQADDILSSTEIFDGETWSSGPNMNQERVSAASARDSSGNVYVIGGADSDGNLLSSVEYWDGSTWVNIPDHPVEVQSGYAAFDNEDNLYHFAGGAGQDNIVTNLIYKYDGSSWSEVGFIPNDKQYEDLIFSGTCVSDDEGDIYLIAGSTVEDNGDQPVLSQVIKYSSGSFTQVSSISEKKDALGSATVLDGTIYVSGGAIVDKSYKTFESFDGSSWNLRSDMNQDRAGHQLVSDSRGRIYAIGGTSVNSNIPSVGDTLSSVERFNPAPEAPSSVSATERN